MVWYVDTDVSGHLLLPLSGWKMETAGSCKILMAIYQTIWHNIPEDCCNHFFLHHFQDNCLCLPLPLRLYSLGVMYKELQYTRNSSSFFTWKLTAVIRWIVCVCVCMCARAWMYTIGGLVSNETMHMDPDLGCWSPK